MSFSWVNKSDHTASLDVLQLQDSTNRCRRQLHASFQELEPLVLVPAGKKSKSTSSPNKQIIPQIVYTNIKIYLPTFSSS